jgi:periplasmic protein TonB
MWPRVGCLGLLIAVVEPSYAQTDAVGEWRKQISVRLEANKRASPFSTLDRTSTAKVSFVIDRTGRLVSSQLTAKTGPPTLDEEALAIVERSAPFPVPPSEVRDDGLRMTIPIVFQPWPAAHREIIQGEATVAAKMRSICRGC